MGDLSIATLLAEIRAQATQPLKIQPTHMIVPEHVVKDRMIKWHLSRKKAVQRIRRIFRIANQAMP